MTGSNTEKNLIIYKASAGSGKTFTLVKEYIAMLLGVGEPQREHERFRHILVVTFTNKATAELRERILNELYTMSQPNEKSGMLDQIISEQTKNTPSLDANQLEKRYRRDAKALLTEILGDYTSFRVQTIDSFFQEVVRSFVFELSSAKAGAEIELSNTEAIETSLDKMLRELDSSDPVFKWVENLYTEALEEGSRLNVQQSAAQVAEKLLYSEYESIITESDEYTPEKISKQKEALKAFLNTAEEEIDKDIDSIRTLLDNDEELAEDSYYGFLKKFFTKEPADFIKDFVDKGNVIDSRVQTKIRDKKDFKIYKGKPANSNSKVRLESIKGQLVSLLEDFISMTETHAVDYITAKILLQHLDLIPIMQALKSRLEAYQNENNILLISEVNDLMKEIIDGSSVPFLYEKVGGKISNYMIDEFQDTSHTQWENFRPLLEESLAGGEENKDSYLVGDVKQSIYRWRGADSSILNSKVGKNFHTNVDERVLKKNWRSDGEVIKFNNEFFHNIYSFKDLTDFESALTDEEQKNVSLVYSDAGVAQEIGGKNKDKGYVRVELLENEDEEEQAKRLKDYIDECIESGYEPRDIAFLVRDNREAATIASILESFSADPLVKNHEWYKFLSNEALLISNSAIVQIIVATIKHQILQGANSSDIILEVMLKRYFHDREESIDTASIKDKLLALPAEQYSILEFAIKIANILGELPEEEKIYLNSFLDLITEFTDTHTPTYMQFSIWWDRISEKKYIDMGGSELNSIQILTIHKSKGLEFPIVIIPFADWEISKNRGRGITVCSKSDIKDFDLPCGTELFSHYLVPDTTSKSQLNSKLGDFYKRIYEQNYMDNLNLLYVAFTRAVNRLYVVSRKVSSKKPYNLVSDIIQNRLSLSDNNPYERGEKSNKAITEEDSESPIKLQHSFVPQSLLNMDIGIRDNRYSDSHTERGIMLHDVMARSQDTDDFDNALERLFLQHDIDSTEYTELRKDAQECFNQSPIIRDWFTLGKEKRIQNPTLIHRTILNEVELYDKRQNRVLRPDRVILDRYEDRQEAIVIDYKFGKKEQKYHRQVERYMAYFQDSGYETQGYIWYNLMEVDKVTK